MKETNAIDLLKTLVGFDTTSYKSNLEMINFIKDYLNKLNVKSTLIYDDDNKEHYFDYINTPDMNIFTAISISSCIPLIFMPIEFSKF